LECILFRAEARRTSSEASEAIQRFGWSLSGLLQARDDSGNG
jgi:hypothetical protein